MEAKPQRPKGRDGALPRMGVYMVKASWTRGGVQLERNRGNSDLST